MSEKKDIRVYFCTECLSTDVRYIFRFGNLFGMMPKMKCLTCNYCAQVFPILETNKKEIAKLKNKKKKKAAALKKSAASKSGKKVSTNKKVKKTKKKVVNAKKHWRTLGGQRNE